MNMNRMKAYAIEHDGQFCIGIESPDWSTPRMICNYYPTREPCTAHAAKRYFDVETLDAIEVRETYGSEYELTVEHSSLRIVTHHAAIDPKALPVGGHTSPIQRPKRIKDCTYYDGAWRRRNGQPV